MAAITVTRTDRVSLPVLVAAWAAPVLVLGGFALISGAAVAVVLARSLRDARLRWWAGALAAAYLVPLGLWLTGSSTAPSLTTFLSPVATALVVATGVAVAVAHQVVRRPQA